MLVRNILGHGNSLASFVSCEVVNNYLGGKLVNANIANADGLHKPVCIAPQILEVWVLPFDFAEPFVLGEAYSLCGITKLIIEREKELKTHEELEWNDNDIYPVSPQIIIEVYGDVAQVMIQSTIAAYQIDWDESDYYIVIRTK